MPKTMEHARTPKACTVCGREISANNYARHLAKHESTNGSTPARRGRKPGAHSSAEQTKRAGALAVGRYLEQLEHEALYGRTSVAMLGRLPGFPAASADPDEIDRAADAISARADGTSSKISQLRLRQRVIELRAVADAIREGGGDDAEAAFVELAAAWSEDAGISYAAYREMGVPARVLKAAGISR